MLHDLIVLENNPHTSVTKDHAIMTYSSTSDHTQVGVGNHIYIRATFNLRETSPVTSRMFIIVLQLSVFEPWMSYRL
jgi:hypothetical protein